MSSRKTSLFRTNGATAFRVAKATLRKLNGAFNTIETYRVAGTNRDFIYSSFYETNHSGRRISIQEWLDTGSVDIQVIGFNHTVAERLSVSKEEAEFMDSIIDCLVKKHF